MIQVFCNQCSNSDSLAPVLFAYLFLNLKFKYLFWSFSSKPDKVRGIFLGIKLCQKNWKFFWIKFDVTFHWNVCLVKWKVKSCWKVYHVTHRCKGLNEKVTMVQLIPLKSVEKYFGPWISYFPLEHHGKYKYNISWQNPEPYTNNALSRKAYN